MRKISWIPLLGVVMLMGAGCGDSNDELSYSDLGDQANALCRESNAKLEKLDTNAEQAKVIDEYVDKFEELKAPDVLQPHLDHFVSTARELADALKDGDEDAVSKANEENNLAASKMGAEDCIG